MYEPHRHQMAFRQFANALIWKHPFAVTLTLKQAAMVDRNCGAMFVPLTSEIASQNLRHFLNLLNKRVYGAAASRFDRRLPVIAVLEGSATKRYHYHLLIDCCHEELVDNFPALIKGLWQQTHWGYAQIDVQYESEPGRWLSYMSKLRDKENFADAVDWENCHIATVTANQST